MSRLQRALDANFCPIDLATVLDVVTQLEEVAHISRYDLESTRLAKFINGLRRQTQDDILSSRCRNLLKTWRLMVSMEHPTATSIPIETTYKPSDCIGNLVSPAAVVQQLTSATDGAKIKKHKKKHHKKKHHRKQKKCKDVAGEAKEKKKKSKKHKKHRSHKKKKSLNRTAENPKNYPFPMEMNVNEPSDSTSAPSIARFRESLDLTANSEFEISTKFSTPIHPLLITIPAPIVPIAVSHLLPPLNVESINPPVVKKKRGRKKLLKNMLPSDFKEALWGPPPTSLFMDIRPNRLWKDGRKMKTLRDIIVDLKSLCSVPSDLYDTLLPPPSQPSQPASTDVIETATASTLMPLSYSAPNDCETLRESPPEQKTVGKRSIDEEIKFIYSQLPPINYEALNEVDEDDIVCTCIIDDDFKEAQNNYHSCENITVVIKDNDDIPEACSGSTNENIMFMQSSTLNKKNRLKSIFDLDYNESDDTSDNVEMKREQMAVAIPLRLENSKPGPKTTTMKWVCEEDPNCPAAKKFCKRDESELIQQIDYLNNNFVPNVNGNFSLNMQNGKSQLENNRSEQRFRGTPVPADAIRDVADAVNCVPKYDELHLSMSPKNKTSKTATTTSDTPDVRVATSTEKPFKEWNHTIQAKSYKDENLTILPYCIID